MRDYIILNGKNSNEIDGLLIQILPPISKPLMRNTLETIDGKDGDQVTKLGYSAYNKQVSIGLYGNYDINEVIKYFDSEGKIIFSNEDDKFYYYTILNQIDFDKLIRFRTATVTFHVQPFKYPVEEEPIDGQFQYVTGTGSNISLDNTANSLFNKLDLKGNTEQNGTPTPTEPVDVEVVTGENIITISNSDNTESQSYTIDLDDLELCKIGNYQDYLYKSNGTWYKHSEVGKVVLDGTQTGIRTSTAITGEYRMCIDIGTNIVTADSSTIAPFFCDKLVRTTRGQSWTPVQGISPTDSSFNYKSFIIYIEETKNMTYAEFQTWLSTHNITVYYPLETPTETEITDENLIEQLENLKLATSYEGQTNISHEYSNAPVIFDVSAVELGSGSLIVDNIGNIYSRPILNLEGTGIVNIYLEENQMFQVDMSENNNIVIDTNKMEAYDPTNSALMNRKVVGNYNNFKLNAGENTLKFSGDLTNIEVTNYVRWL